MRPLTIETLACLGAAVLWLAVHRDPVNAACGSHLERIAFVQRNYAAMGISLSTVTERLQHELKFTDAFEDAASFRIRFDRPVHAEVSRSFFEFLGVTPLAGGSLAAQALDAAVITHGLYETEFHSDPTILGQRRLIDGRLYRIVGVLPAEFVFASRRIRYFTPLSEGVPAAGLLVRIRGGTSWQRAEQMLRVIGPQQETGFRASAYRLRPYLATARWTDSAWPAVAFSMLAAAAGCLFLVWRTKITWLFLGVWILRATLAVFALVQLAAVVARWADDYLLPIAILHLWFFAMLGSGIWLLQLRDQLSRCPVCLETLALPTGLGSWGSVMLDAPAIEYACPAGHGFLHRNADRGKRAVWTPLDESWRDLFIRK